MASQYIKCDNCGKTLGAEQVITDRPVGIGDTPELLNYARSIGWQLRTNNTHFCSECVATFPAVTKEK